MGLLVGKVFVATCVLAATNGGPVPLPQQFQRQPGEFDLKAGSVIWLGADCPPDDALAAKDLAERLKHQTGSEYPVRTRTGGDVPDRGIVIGSARSFPALAVAVAEDGLPDGVPQHGQGYAMVATPGRILICGRDASGAYYGTQTLVQLVKQAKGTFVVPAALVRDWPDLQWRGAMVPLYPSGQSWGAALRRIDRCLGLKMNLLYIGDHMNHADGPHRDWPAEQTAKHNAAYKSVIDYARRRHMKIIVACRAHKFPVIYHGKHLPEKPVYFFPDAEGERLMTKHLEELIELVRPDAISIGQDELVTAYGIRKRKPCLEHRIVGRPFVPPAEKRSGVEPHELWARFLAFYHDVLKQRGVELCLWGDCLLSSEEFDGVAMCFHDGIYGGLPDNLYLARDLIPKDVLLFDWKYSNTWCYPSVDLLTGLGFSILAAPWEKPGNTFFFAKYLKENGGDKARGLFNTWWAHGRQPIDPHLEHIADCAWSVGRLAQMPPVIEKLIAVAGEAKQKPQEHLRPGKFHKEFSLLLEDGGHFFSDGWVGGGPDSEDGLSNTRSIGFAVKADRIGHIDFRFATEEGTFQRFVVRPQFRNIGANAIRVTTAAKEEQAWVTVGENQDFQGEPITLAEHVRGKRQLILRFWVHGSPKLKQRTGALTRFIVEGEVAAP